MPRQSLAALPQLQLEVFHREIPNQLRKELIRRGLSLIDVLKQNDDQERQKNFREGLDRFASGQIYPDQLLSLCEQTLGLVLPLQGVCPAHSAPGAYLLDSLVDGGQDAIVLACRGGGKTLLGALLTTLESIIYPHCGTRILGGSGDQSLRMYEHIDDFVSRGSLYSYVCDGRVLQNNVKFLNGSKIKILMASQTSVRGPHVPRLRLDELDEFDPAIYRAALPIRQSMYGLTGSIHIYSTMHRSGGLMEQVVDEAREQGKRVYTWCIWDVAEPCVGRDCESCVLEPDCKGIAKQSRGYYKIDDIIALRTMPGMDENTWQSEILCLKPGTKSLVWPGYNEAVHLFDPEETSPEEFRKRFKRVYAGVDWGYENPAVIIVVGEDPHGVLYVIEEFYRPRMLDEELGKVAKELRKRWGIERFWCDPESPSSIEKWRRMGLKAMSADNRVEKGISLVASRFQLLPPHNRPRILMSRSCVNLRREIKGYRRRGDDVHGGPVAGDEKRENIIKKNDHACDAFRYVVAAFDRGPKWGT